MTQPSRPPHSLSKTAVDLLRKAASLSPHFLIAASGGKDSNVLFPLLDDLRQEMPSVKFAAFHWYMVPPFELCGKPGIDCVERPIRILCDRYKVPLFFVPHYSLPDQLYLGEVRPSTAPVRGCERCKMKGHIADKSCACEGKGFFVDGTICTDCRCPRCRGNGQGVQALKATQCEDAGRLEYAAHLAGLRRDDLLAKDSDGRWLHPIGELPVHPWRDIWVLGGHRQSDSLERRAMISGFRMQANSQGIAVGGQVGLNINERRVYPIYNWPSKSVLSFVRARKVPPAADLGDTNTTNLDPSQHAVVESLKTKYPRDYRRLLEVFPNARATSDIPTLEEAYS